MVFSGPFNEFELPDERRFQPAAIDHLLRGQPGTPASGLRLWKICEWTRRDLQRLKPLHEILSQPWRESVAGPRCVNQLAVLVVAEDQRVERRATDRVPTD